MKKPSGEIPLYMAFPDGAFDYVCAECTALCCRGQGFAGSLRREMPKLLSIYPALGSAALARQGSLIVFGTPAGKCFFLDEDNMCRIEKDHGKSLKPGACSLFPFNKFTRIGRVVAVAPHFLCPIRLLVPARPGQVQGTHAAVDSAVRESALLDSEYIDTYMPAVSLHGSQDGAAVVEREESFRDSCSRSLARRTFYETLAEQSTNPHILESFTGRAAQIMGLEAKSSIQERDCFDDMLLALAPSQRISLLHMESESILRALAIGEIVLRQMTALSPFPITPQGASGMLNSIGPALRLLARGDESIELAGKASLKSPAYGDPDMAFAAFTAIRKISNGTGVLDALENAIKPDMPVSYRSALLVQLGSQIERAPLKGPKRHSKENVAPAV